MTGTEEKRRLLLALALLLCVAASPSPGGTGECGYPGQPCCHGPRTDNPPARTGTLPGYCFLGATCSGGSDTCACGGKDQQCCQPEATCHFGLECSNLVCVQRRPGGQTCAQCTADLATCLMVCATDPAHQAACQCLCRNTACDCRQRYSCASCQPESCAAP